jgi:2-(1,2-epoxy-1,2-dihydrophenyl)acetyl-CoA isomerase
MSEVLLYDLSDGIATITLNRPDSLNALNEEISQALQKAVQEAAGDRAARCVVITGAGRAFTSGADLSDIEGFSESGEKPDLGDILRRRYNPVILPIVQMEKPVIASLNGVAAGAGASLALACDFRIASEKAKLFQAFIKVGLVPDSGAHYFLTRLVGIAKAAELAMLGDIIDAHECLRLGLVTKVVPPEALQEETRTFALKLAAGPTRAYALSKKALHFAAQNDIASTLDYEADLQSEISTTEDHIEGILSFIQKRTPEFKGR